MFSVIKLTCITNDRHSKHLTLGPLFVKPRRSVSHLMAYLHQGKAKRNQRTSKIDQRIIYKCQRNWSFWLLFWLSVNGPKVICLVFIQNKMNFPLVKLSGTSFERSLQFKQPKCFMIPPIISIIFVWPPPFSARYLC